MGPNHNWSSLVKCWFSSARLPPRGKKVSEVYQLEKKYLEVQAKHASLLREGLSKGDAKVAKLLEEEQALIAALNNFWGSGR